MSTTRPTTEEVGYFHAIYRVFSDGYSYTDSKEACQSSIFTFEVPYTASVVFD